MQARWWCFGFALSVNLSAHTSRQNQGIGLAPMSGRRQMQTLCTSTIYVPVRYVSSTHVVYSLLGRIGLDSRLCTNCSRLSLSTSLLNHQISRCIIKRRSAYYLVYTKQQNASIGTHNIMHVRTQPELNRACPCPTLAVSTILQRSYTSVSAAVGPEPLTHLSTYDLVRLPMNQ